MSGTYPQRDRVRDLDHSTPAMHRVAGGTAMEDVIKSVIELQNRFDAMVAANAPGATARTLPNLQPLVGGTRVAKP